MDDPTPRLDRSATATWRVELLGQARARRGEHVVTSFGSRKVLALLARLALAPERAHPREELIDLLWPEADLDTGRNRLRQALATLRRVLEVPGAGDIIVADRQQLRLQPDTLRCDAVEFAAAVAKRDWTRALELYRGELMPGSYDEWVLEERQRFIHLADQAAAGQARDAASRTAATSSPPVAARRAATLRLTRHQTWFPDRWEQLPSYASRFFGRASERASLREAIDSARLVTVKGPGGAGKTRLAIEVAHEIATRFELVAFVPLADCADPHDLPARIAATLPMHAGGRDAAAVGKFLEGRSAVLVLDNFEQLVSPAAAALLGAWLQRLPKLHLLVTSRRRLDVEGELVLAVEPLALPREESSLQECADAAAIALFVDRSAKARPGFALTDRNRHDVLAVCRIVEGLPLAIELAASRAHAFSVADIAAQVSRCAMDLRRRSARSGTESRHASLRVALAWSWALLTESERSALIDLSVFRGGCTLEAATAVLGGDDAVGAVEALVGDALVVAETGAHGSMRYRLYDMVREFATEQASDERLRDARGRLGRWCLEGLHAQAADWPSEEAENLHAAMRDALADGRPAFTLELAVAARRHWRRHGAGAAVLDIWQQALAACDAASQDGASQDDQKFNDLGQGEARAVRLYIDARRLLARLWFEAGAGGTHALNLAAAAVAQARGLVPADADALSCALATWASIRWSGEPVSAGLWPALDEALSLSMHASAETRATLLNLAGEVHLIGDDDTVAARVCYEQALQLFLDLGWAREALGVELGLGICAQYERRYADARVIQLRVASGAAELDDRMLQVDAENNLCVIATRARDWPAALHHGQRQLALATRWNAPYMQALALWNLAKPLARLRLADIAAQLMAFAADHWTRHYGQLRAQDRRYVVKVNRFVRFQIGAARLAAQQAAGRALSMAQARRLAMEARNAASSLPTEACRD